MKEPLKVICLIYDAKGTEKARYAFSGLSQKDVVLLQATVSDALNKAGADIAAKKK